MNNDSDRRAGHLDDEQRQEVLGNVAATLNGPDMYGRQGATMPSMQEITNSKCVEHLQKEIEKQISAAQVRIVTCQNDIRDLEAEIEQNRNYQNLLNEIQRRLK